jgi:phosphonoacetaldehyde hydrolase
MQGRALVSVKAVVFDWAGTMIDHGSRAPMGAFVKVLGEFGVDISVAEARRPMGLPKWDHINALLTHPDIARRWTERHGTQPSDRDVDRVFEVFVPLNAAVVTDFADLIPGTLETLAELRGRGIKIGSTTGYTRDIMERLLPVAAQQGLAPDTVVCAGDLAGGRPAPHMMWKCFLDLDVWPASAVVKVDDTEAGIAEGLAAGCWTVGVALSGNACGLSRGELEALTPAERHEARLRATRQLSRCGAHVVIDSIADLPRVIDDIDGRLVRGERP